MNIPFPLYISSPRSHSSFIAHCEKDLLILFGGEYYDGQSTHMYNDLIIYNIKVRI